MVHGETEKNAKSPRIRPLKENQGPVVALSRPRGKGTDMANASKPGKSSKNSKPLNKRSSTSTQDKTSAGQNSHPQDSKTSGPPQGNRLSSKVSQANEKQPAQEKATTVFPPLVPKQSGEPRPSKVVFQPSSTESWPKRRLSIPSEMVPASQRSILKKRNSICTDSFLHGHESSLKDAAALWSVPWERETHFPHMGPKGLLLFHDEAIPVPPVQRRMSLKANYSYSQEFSQALSELQSRPASRHGPQLLGKLTHQKVEVQKVEVQKVEDQKEEVQKVEVLKPVRRRMSKHEHFATRQELLHLPRAGTPMRRYSE